MSAKNHPFSKAEARQTAKNRAGYTRFKPPTKPPTAGPQQGQTPPSPSYSWNDYGNAQRLLDAGGREALLHVEKRMFPFLYWDGVCWRWDMTNYVGAWMERVLVSAYQTVWMEGLPRSAQIDEAKHLLQSLDSAKITAGLGALTRHVSIKGEQLDTHDWLLPCADGRTYDLERGQVIRSRPDHLMTRAAPVEALTQAAPHPRWDDFMRLLFGDDDALITYVQWMLGLFLTGYTGEKTFWFVQGETDAGKTTLLKFAHWLLGLFAYGIPLRALLKTRQETGILHDIAGVEGKRFVFAEEFKPGDLLDASWVKRLTGEGLITADRKGEPNIEFVSRAKLVIGTNTMPALTDVDSALRRRVRVVRFPNNIPALLRARGQEPPSANEVLASLQTEGAAILYDLAQRVTAWNLAGRPDLTPATVLEASKQYLDAQDLLMEWLEVCFAKEADGVTSTKRRIELSQLTWYWSYLEQSGHADSQSFYQRFGELLRNKGFEGRRTPKGWYYTGPALTDEALRVAQEAALRAERKKKGDDAYGYGFSEWAR